MNFKKRILKESTTEPLKGPELGPESGLATLLIEAINGEWDTINMYNTLVVNARSEGFDNIANILDEINTEENKHVGQLQELLKSVSPNANAIDDGEVEAQDQVDDDVSWYNNEDVV